MIAHEHAGTAFAKGQRLIIAALCLAEHDKNQRADQHDGQKGGQQIKADAGQVAGFLKIPLNLLDLCGGNAKLNQLLLRCRFRAFGGGGLVAIIKGDDDLVAGDFEPLDIACFDIAHKVCKANFLNALACAAEADEDNKDDKTYTGIDQGRSEPRINHWHLRSMSYYELDIR